MNLKERRESLGWSLGDLEARALVSRAKIRDLEEGSGAIDQNAFSRVCRALGCSTAEVEPGIVEAQKRWESEHPRQKLTDDGGRPLLRNACRATSCLTGSHLPDPDEGDR